MPNDFKPNIGRRVPVTDAKRWISEFQKTYPNQTRSVFYGRETFEKLLSEPRVTGISFFFCRKVNESGEFYNDLVLLGTQEDGTVIWGDDDGSKQSLDDPGIEGPYNSGLPCPPHCK